MTTDNANTVIKNFKPWILAAEKELAHLRPGETMYVKYNSLQRMWTLVARYFAEEEYGHEDEAKWRLIMSLGKQDYQARDIYEAGICQEWDRCLTRK